MRTAVLGAVLLAVGLVALATGILSPTDAAAVADRVWPILLFVIAITVVTELAADAGLFTVVAERLARWGLDRAWLLWLFVVVLATISTIFLSLDTTAVLLTPVVVLLARHVGLSPMPFALTTVWLANTGSLLLPVSNLTNLLSEEKLGTANPLEFAAMLSLPALVSIVIPSAVLFIVFRRELVKRYTQADSEPSADRILLISSAVVVVLLIPALVSGLAVWIPAVIAAVVLAAIFAMRRPKVLRFSLLPWQIVLFASGLFLVIEAGHSLGLTDALGALVGTSESASALLRVAGVGAGAANLVNNLPAYLALEPVAGSPLRIAALLIGVNVGPLITPWASLATLLWHDRLVGLDVKVSWWRFVGLGLIVVPLTVIPATLALLLR